MFDSHTYTEIEDVKPVYENRYPKKIQIADLKWYLY